jgi:hypothetical protein
MHLATLFQFHTQNGDATKLGDAGLTFLLYWIAFLVVAWRFVHPIVLPLLTCARHDWNNKRSKCTQAKANQVIIGWRKMSLYQKHVELWAPQQWSFLMSSSQVTANAIMTFQHHRHVGMMCGNWGQLLHGAIINKCGDHKSCSKLFHHELRNAMATRFDAVIDLSQQVLFLM